MTDQFSQEYIAYVREAKALQEHDLECWDSFMWEGAIYVVTGVGCDGVYAAKRDGRAKASWFNTREDLAGRELWLPTLLQLIRVIEGANEGQTHWRIFRMRDGRRKYAMAVHTFGKHEHSANSDDLMLAAAQLAVRAVEGK